MSAAATKRHAAPFLEAKKKMKPRLIFHLLIPLSLIALPPFAAAKQDLAPERSSSQTPLPDKDDTLSGPPSQPAMPVAGPRGQLLYENHCQDCHTSIVHVRDAHRVRTMDDLEHAVSHWAAELKLDWSDDEIGDVVDYLSQRYYQLQ